MENGSRKVETWRRNVENCLKRAQERNIIFYSSRKGFLSWLPWAGAGFSETSVWFDCASFPSRRFTRNEFVSVVLWSWQVLHLHAGHERVNPMLSILRQSGYRVQRWKMRNQTRTTFQCVSCTHSAVWARHIFSNTAIQLLWFLPRMNNFAHLLFTISLETEWHKWCCSNSQLDWICAFVASSTIEDLLPGHCCFFMCQLGFSSQVVLPEEDLTKEAKTERALTTPMPWPRRVSRIEFS